MINVYYSLNQMYICIVVCLFIDVVCTFILSFLSVLPFNLVICHYAT